MAEMALGYGSEYQMLRFLGHHRIRLEKEIREQTIYKSRIDWLDFPFDNRRLSLDGEYTGIEFLKDDADYEEIKKKWKEYWPQDGNAQNWDAIFRGDVGYVFVEAKAHEKEMHSDCGSKDAKNRRKIEDAMKKTKERFEIGESKDWLKHNYQLANRLAFLAFMFDNGMPSSLLNVYFINGYKKRKKQNDKLVVVKDLGVKSKREWEKELQLQYKYLGIEGTPASQFVNSVFINCDR